MLGKIQQPLLILIQIQFFRKIKYGRAIRTKTKYRTRSSLSILCRKYFPHLARRHENFQPREVPRYENRIDEDLLRISFDLKEKRLRSNEGLLFLNNQNKNQYSDDLLSGENENYRIERQNYVKYLLQKHQKSLPSELTKDKLSRKARRLPTLRSKVYFLFFLFLLVD